MWGEISEELQSNFRFLKLHYRFQIGLISSQVTFKGIHCLRIKQSFPPDFYNILLQFCSVKLLVRNQLLIQHIFLLSQLFAVNTVFSSKCDKQLWEKPGLFLLQDSLTGVVN